MKKIYFLAAGIVLAGCAHVQKVSVVSTSPRTVVILSFTGIADAQTMASDECKKHGRNARYSSTLPGTIEYVFDCVQ
jgi:hypothetical protein